jgi:hypothetical protein
LRPFDAKQRDKGVKATEIEAKKPQKPENHAANCGLDIIYVKWSGF